MVFHGFSASHTTGEYYNYFKAHVLETVMYWGAYTAFGMSVSIMGAALPFLQCQVNISPTTMSWIVFIQLIFIMVGSLFSSFIHDNYHNLLMILAGISMPVTLFLVPLVSSPILLALLLVIMGLSMGTADNLANVSVVQIYREYLGPTIQTMYFLYGFGAFMTQIISDPFLGTEPTNCSQYNRMADIKYSGGVDVHLLKPFSIVALLQVLIFILICFTICIYNKRKASAKTADTARDSTDDSTKTADAEQESGNPEGESAPISKYFFICTVILAAFLCFLLDGLQSSYGEYATSNLVKIASERGESADDASMIGLFYWGFFCLGRLLTIFVSLKLSLTFILYGDMVTMFLGVLILLTSRETGAIYCGSSLMGLALSNTTPTVMSLSQHYIDLSKYLTTAIVISASLGESIMPLIVGTILSTVGSTGFAVVNTGLVLITGTVFFIFITIGSRTEKSQKYQAVKMGKSLDGEKTAIKMYRRMNNHESKPVDE